MAPRRGERVAAVLEVSKEGALHVLHYRQLKKPAESVDLGEARGGGSWREPRHR